MEDMDNFIIEGHSILKEVKDATRLFQWVFGIAIVFTLGMVVDTRIDVVAKVDAAELYEYYPTKQNIKTIQKLEEEYYKNIISSFMNGDSVVIDESNYQWLVDGILSQEYRGGTNE